MKTKTISYIISSFLVMIFACNRTDFSSPEKVLQAYRQLSFENKNDILYQDFLSSKSKEYVTKDEFIKTVQISDSDIKKRKVIENKISSYSIDVNYPSYRRFKVDEAVVVDNDTLRDRYYYSLINENGYWKIIWTETLNSFAEQKSFDGNYSEARKTLEKSIELNPFSGDAYDRLAWTYNRDKSLNEDERERGMVKNAKYALTLEEDCNDHYNTIASYYRSIGNEDLAIENYKRALAFCLNDGQKVTLYSNIAGGYLSLGKYELAEEFISKAISKDSADTFAWFKYGSIMYDQEKFDKAIEYLQIALSLPPMENANQGLLYSAYAVCCFKTHKCSLAKEYINKALDIDPSNKGLQVISKGFINYCREQ